MDLKNFLVNFEELVENSPDSVYLLDLEGKFLYANKAAKKFLNSEDLVGKSISEIASVGNLNGYLERVRRIKNGERVEAIIIEWPSKADPQKHVEISYNPIVDENNKIIALHGIARDITNRISLEQDIFKIKNILENIFDSITDEMFIVNKNAEIVRANQAFLNNSHFKKFNDILGKNCNSVYQGGKICNEEIVGLCYLSGESQACIEFTENDKAFKEVQYYPVFDGSGSVMQVICYAKDISEKVKAEKKLESQNKKLMLLQEIEKEMNGVLELNVLLRHILSGLVKFGFNNSSLFLINEEEDTLEGIMSTIVSQEEMRSLLIPLAENQTISQIISQKKPLSSRSKNREKIFEDLYIEADVKSFAVLPLIVEDNVIGILKLISEKEIFMSEEDIALFQLFANDAALAINRAVLYDKLNSFNKRLKIKVKEATTELMAKNMRLREADQVKTQLLSIISHELRTPLTSIKGYSSLFLNEKLGELNEKQKECARIIDVESDKLKEVINDVVNLSNLVSGKDKLILENCDIASIIWSVIEEYRPKANERKIEIIFNEEDVPNVRADHDKIKSLVSNLISNAIKFNKEEGKVVIEIDDSQHFIQVSVRDTGIGIEKQDIEKVFEEFVQLEKHLTRVGTGTGIGLSTAKEIVDLHQGDIWVESIPGKRTTFYFTIPKSMKQNDDSKIEEDVKRVVGELESIRTVSSIVHKDFELDQVIEIILQSIKHAIGFDRVRLYLTNKDNSVLQGRAAIGTPNIEEIKVPIKDNTVLQEIFSSKKAKIYNQSFAKGKTLLEDSKNLPFAAMPLIIRKKYIGVIVADNLISDKKISSTMLESLTTFANNAAITIENSRLYNEMEIQVEERTRKLQELNEKLNEFMGYLSHELRTPLTSIIGYSKLLSSGKLSGEKVSRSIEIINTEALRLNQLIDDYLDLNKLESGKMPLKRSRSNIFDIGRDVIEMFKPQSKEKNLNLELRGDSVFLDIDPLLIKQAFINLVNNAVKFTDKGSVVLEVMDEGAQVKILIIDTGIGIAEEDQPKVFDKFVQVHNNKSDYKGSGLGMPITKKIIESHGGTIKLRSELGKGSKFILSLPKEPPQSI